MVTHSDILTYTAPDSQGVVGRARAARGRGLGRRGHAGSTPLVMRITGIFGSQPLSTAPTSSVTTARGCAGSPGPVTHLSGRFERVAGRTGGLSGLEKRLVTSSVELSRAAPRRPSRAWGELRLHRTCQRQIAGRWGMGQEELTLGRLSPG